MHRIENNGKLNIYSSDMPYIRDRKPSELFNVVYQSKWEDFDDMGDTDINYLYKEIVFKYTPNGKLYSICDVRSGTLKTGYTYLSDCKKDGAETRIWAEEVIEKWVTIPKYYSACQE